ncbi:MAG: trimeric intracellular cation channel family protein [Bacteroidaceae bacterium]|nr:trimeric intracellular cation channel family protein [Bacteroidaceae bacterium]MBR5884370.1 trimeric intracellular cation channel family protein [Bacteroidaceae bacterium]
MTHWLMDILQEMGHTLRLPISFVCIEFVGTMAFAISGVRLASAKRFDIFGAWIIGLATAIGGGTIRDLMLGVNPFWMTNSIYFICCAMAVFWVSLFGKHLVRQSNTLFIFDTIGLALFNVIGIEKTLNMGFPYWTAVTMGCITGAAGGVLRDVFINEIPLIFRKEIYALACVSGGLVYILCHKLGMTPEINALLSILVVILIRSLAVKYHWCLPILKGEEESIL